MGKIITVTSDSKNIEGEVDHHEWAALVTLAGISFVTTLVFPLVSVKLLEPFLMANYGHVAQLSQDNILIMVLMLVILVLLPLGILLPHRKHRHIPAYMGGRTTSSDMRFHGSLGVQKKMVLSNYYLTRYFGETKLKRAGIWLCTACIVVMLAGVVAGGILL